ncbi:MAG: hypothetical protein QHI48_11705 [Bacteroidota bacterium]|nr:hypothetical protein [Bacteroidota bacterium]
MSPYAHGTSLPRDRHRRGCIAPAGMLCAFLLALVGSGCEDRLPSSPDFLGTPDDSLSDNAFVLDGYVYRHRVFNLSRASARAYAFPEDTVTSILNVDSVRAENGVSVGVVVHMYVPSLESGSFPWRNALVDPAAKSKVRLVIGNEEYVSVRGSTQMFVFLDVMTKKVRGTYSGILESAAGKQIILSSGRFSGVFF